MCKLNLRYKNLAKNSMIFLIANFGSKFLSFILVPFYTHVLNTGEYGTVDTLVSTVSLFSPIATLGIGDVIIMFLSKKEYDAKKIFTNATLLILIGNFLVSFIYPLFFIFNIFREFILYFILLVIISSIYGVLQMYIRGIGKVAACAASGVIYTFTLAVSNIILLLYFKQGISGYLISAVLAYLLPSLYLLVIATDKCFKYSFIDINLIKQILKLSIPLMPTAILWVLMNLSDKYAILWFVGASGNGIYAVAHKIPTIISVVYGIFQQAWQLTTFELETKEERSRTYTNVFELLTGILFILGGGLILLNRVYITYGCNENYLEAWKISPILMYSSILNCVSGLLGSNYLIMHDTKSALKVTAVGAIINTILNFILVPIYGLYGAALATIVGYLYMIVKPRRQWPPPPPPWAGPHGVPRPSSTAPPQSRSARRPARPRSFGFPYTARRPGPPGQKPYCNRAVLQRPGPGPPRHRPRPEPLPPRPCGPPASPPPPPGGGPWRRSPKFPPGPGP